jgi:hypothetical protein
VLFTRVAEGNRGERARGRRNIVAPPRREGTAMAELDARRGETRAEEEDQDGDRRVPRSSAHARPRGPRRVH